MTETVLISSESDSGPGNSFAEAVELNIKIKHELKGPARHNPKLAVFREFVLASVYSKAKEHQQHMRTIVSPEQMEDETVRQMYACDLAAHSGLAGLQWKKHIGTDVSVTVVEPRDAQLLLSNMKENDLLPCDLPLHPECPAGTPLPHQSASEIHVARCDAGVLMLLEAFDFIYVDPHKNPSSYFSTLFRNTRNEGVACIIVPDTMHFARTPHVVKRCYNANCIKTEYLKELAVRIVTASLAVEAAKCNKGLTMLYAVSFEDFLLLCVRIKRGPKAADSTLQSIGQVLHCRMCEERAFYPDLMAPQEDPYKMLGCKCHENVPGKTAVILGPLWKGSLYSWQFLQELAKAGQKLNLSSAFFSLLQHVMEDCLCDTPPSLSQLKNIPSTPKDKCPKCQGSQTSIPTSPVKSGSAELPSDDVKEGSGQCDSQDRCSSDNYSAYSADKSNANTDTKVNGRDVLANVSGEYSVDSKDGGARKHTPSTVKPSKDIVADSTTPAAPGGGDSFVCGESPVKSICLKRSAAESGVSAEDGHRAETEHKRLKMEEEPPPAPCFYYSVHSKRLGKNHLPKQNAIIERLRSHGYRCCRTHFDRYALRTDADLSALTTLLGSGESKVLFVKGLESSAVQS